ncbi:MAG: polysaccharide biosynthesis/export family protein [Oceanococcaceae bacterium]
MHFLLSARYTLATALLILLTACAAGPRPADGAATNMAEPFSATNYAIAPTDTLRIDVYREPDLSGEYYVDPSGTINMPLLGRVSVGGETVETVERKIALALARGYLVDPDVRASVIRFRPIFIGGEVNKPGAYPFTPGMTVQQAVVLAGGETRFAANRYYLQRESRGASERVRVDGNSVLFPGDVITIGERVF